MEKTQGKNYYAKPKTKLTYTGLCYKLEIFYGFNIITKIFDGYKAEERAKSFRKNIKRFTKYFSPLRVDQLNKYLTLS